MSEETAQGYQTNFAPQDYAAAATNESSSQEQGEPQPKSAPKDVNMDSDFCDEGQESRAKIWEVAVAAFKRFVLFISFGPGVVGFLCLLGKILKR
jgi:hypothetical protein